MNTHQRAQHILYCRICRVASYERKASVLVMQAANRVVGEAAVVLAPLYEVDER